MKTFFKLLLLVVISGYLIFAFIRVNNTEDKSVCTEVKVSITNREKAGFITQKEVERLLSLAGLNPIGQLMDSVNGLKIESFLMKNPFVKGVTSYKMPGGKVNIIVEQRLPVMRVMPAKGDSYYIDERGEAMMSLNYNTDLIVATGNIDSCILHNGLIDMALYLRENPFWNDQITQINVKENQQLDLVTRIGGNILIHFGTPDSIARKFGNLKAFYQKVMPDVGWNTYKEIDLGYNNQIVCKKRK